MDCADLLSVAIVAILQLASEGTSATVINIAARGGLLCPAAGITPTLMQEALDRGVLTGVVIACYNAQQELIYEVNWDMRRLHAGNTKYYVLLDPTVLLPTVCTPLIEN
jgi:hypothetical protein